MTFDVKQVFSGTNLYRAFGYFGIATIFGTLLMGFRPGISVSLPAGFDPSMFGGADSPFKQTSYVNYLLDILLYAAFAVPHLVMTRSWFKKAMWGSPQGSIRERQVYIGVSVVTWLLVYAFHLPLPGPSLYGLVHEEWWGHVVKVIEFVGYASFVLCIMAFFQGITFAMVDGLLGVPGTEKAFSHTGEVVLFTDGPYAGIRHPMYRAALLACLSSVLIHPYMAQLFWAILISGTFLAFIPVEEGQLIAARGQAYLDYKVKTPFRIFRGIW